MKTARWIARLCLFALLIAVIATACKQKKEGEQPKDQMDANGLFPGEVRDRMWPVPILAAVRDTSCSKDTTCPAKGVDCMMKTFTVQKDTTYILTTSYFNGDTIHASCRACGVVWEDTTVILQIATACPTGGPWAASTRLKKGHTYSLSVCLQRCPQVPDCNCGPRVFADAVLSIRPVFD